MTLRIKKKEVIVDKINKIIKDTLSAVTANYRGITANKLTELRKISRNCGVYIYVIRNTLLLRAIKGTNFECLKSVLVGPTIIGFAMKNPSSVARIFKNFERENTDFKIKAAVFEGQFISSSQIDYLVNIPSYKEAIARLIKIIQEVSINRFIRILYFISKKS